MKIKKIIASLLAVAVMGVSMPTYADIVPNVSITASAEEDFTEVEYDDFSVKQYSDHVEISKVNGEPTELVIPSEIGGLPVTSIGYFAFRSCTSLTSVTLPESITSIDAWAFYYCTSLTSITLPDSLTSISSGAFYECASLTSIAIPDSLTSIDSSTFAYCTSLISITIPDSVTSIDGGAFSGCTSLTLITIPDSVTDIGGDAFLNTPWLENKQKDDPLVIVNNILIDGKACSGDVVIPDSVTSIGNSAFNKCESLTSVTIPDSVTSIGSGAFYKCASLTSIAIPESVESIGGAAFGFCEKLDSVTIENPDCDICTGYDMAISNGANEYSGAPYYNGSICGYEGSTAQELCKNYAIKFMDINNRSMKPGKEGVLTYYKHDDHIEILSCDETAEGEIIVPETIEGLPVTKISNAAFLENQKITSIKLPESVESIDEWTFYGCEKLESINIPSKVKVIDTLTFCGCRSLTTITLPDSVTSISNYAFSGCTGLTEITIPDSVTHIGNDVFSGCTGLTKITILNPNCNIYINETINDTTTIYGYKNSTAQEYAEKYNMNFVVLDGEDTTTTTTTTATSTTTTTTSTSTTSSTTSTTTTSTTTTSTTTSTTTTTTTTTTTAEPATTTTGEVDLPQTGNNSLSIILLFLGSFMMIGFGIFAVKTSGLNRCKENE